MIKQLIKLANHLDAKGYTKEAGYIDNILIKISEGDEGLTGEGRGLSQYEMSDAGELSYPSGEGSLEGIDRIYSEEDFKNIEQQLAMQNNPDKGYRKLFPESADQRLMWEADMRQKSQRYLSDKSYDSGELRLGTEEVPGNVMNAEDMSYFRSIINEDPIETAVAFAQAYNISDNEDERDNLILFFEKSLKALRSKSPTAELQGS
tara:strand:- start:484 stop:1098 length:615 start_codon:yes stop_codon:yes gene_type:complete